MPQAKTTRNRNIVEHSSYISEYKTQLARDCDWLIFSPPLIQTPCFGFQRLDFTEFPEDVREIKAWLQHIDQTPPEIAPEHRHFKRLGLYFEALLEFLFTHGAKDGVIPYKMITRNLQIPEQGQTLGELDFLLERRDGKIFHLEAAVKFYLAAASDKPCWTNWIGPNAKDRLDIKLKRMFSHQLTLSSRSESSNQLHKLGIQQRELTPLFLIKGFFFTQWQTPFIPPTHGNPNSLVGFWLRESIWREMVQLDQGLPDGNLSYEDNNQIYTWCPLTRMHWLADTIDRLEERSHRCQVPPFNIPILFDYLVSNKRNDISTIVSRARIAVVSDNWPSVD